MSQVVSMQEAGVVASVSTRPVGSSLTATALAGTRSLEVEDNVDLEPGATIQITLDDALDTALAYRVVSVDGDTGVTISALLPVDIDEGTFVALTPDGVETFAQVRLAEGGETISCRVPHDLVDVIRHGVRDEATAETVLVDRIGDEFVVVDVVGRPTVRDLTDSVIGEEGLNLPDALVELQVDLANLNNVTLPQLNLDLAYLAGGLSGIQGLFPITGTSISDDAITTPKIAANQIIGDHILANSIGADHIITNSIGADQIAANSIGADKIVANSIGADRLAANVFTAITIDASQITSGAISTNRLEVNGAGATPFRSDVAVQGLLMAQGSHSGRSIVAAADIEAGGQVRGDSVASLGAVTATNLWTYSAPEVSATANAFIGANGQICKSTSSRRRKTDIEDLGIDVDTLLDLRPRQFRSLSPVEDSDEIFTGFIAEEADELGLTPWVGYDEDGRPDSFSYPSWVAALQKIARHQRDQIADTTAQIADLTDRLTALEAA